MCKIISQEKIGKELGIGLERTMKLVRIGHFKDAAIFRDGAFVGLNKEFVLSNLDSFRFYKARKCIKCKGEIPITQSTKAKYCSKECSGKYLIKHCEKCGVEYKSENYGSKYCSNKCRAARTFHSINCKVCNSPFLSKVPNAMYCSKACWHTKIKADSLSKKKARPVEVKQCQCCSVQYTEGKRLYCSEKCAKTAHNNKRKENDKATMMALFVRDKFRCVYCGCSSISDGVKLVGDHINPIAKGGQHDVYNIVTCCTACNSAKKDNELDDDVLNQVLSIVKERNDAMTVEKRFALRNVERVITGLNRPSAKGVERCGARHGPG